MRRAWPDSTQCRTSSAAVRVLPAARPPSSSQVRQSPSGGRWAVRARGAPGIRRREPARAGIGVPVPRRTVDDRRRARPEGLLGPGDAPRGVHQAGHGRCSSLVSGQSSESVPELGGRGSVRAAHAQATGSEGGSPHRFARLRLRLGRGLLSPFPLRLQDFLDRGISPRTSSPSSLWAALLVDRLAIPRLPRRRPGAVPAAAPLPPRPLPGIPTRDHGRREQTTNAVNFACTSSKSFSSTPTPPPGPPGRPPRTPA